MSNLNYLTNMASFIKLLESQRCGTAEDLAKTLNVSRRTIFRYMEELRDRGVEINYCKTKNCYKLTNKVNIVELFLQSAL